MSRWLKISRNLISALFMRLSSVSFGESSIRHPSCCVRMASAGGGYSCNSKVALFGQSLCLGGLNDGAHIAIIAFINCDVIQPGRWMSKPESRKRES
jgi:hypothetical protein